jgi:hypothetical protein
LTFRRPRVPVQLGRADPLVAIGAASATNLRPAAAVRWARGYWKQGGSPKVGTGHAEARFFTQMIWVSTE